MTFSMTHYTKEKSSLLALIDTEVREHKERLLKLQAELSILEQNKALADIGLDQAKVDHAKSLLYVRGTYQKAGQDREFAVKTAINLISNGGSLLFKEFVATKSYASWHGQYLTCEYGMCPRHGTLLFELGLKKEVRAKGLPLDADEIESCLYYLYNIEKIHEAERAATLQTGKEMLSSTNS